MDFQKTNDLILKGNIKEALQYLSSHDLDSEYQKEAKMISVRFNSLKSDHRKGLLLQDEYSVHLNKVTSDLLDLIDTIQKKGQKTGSSKDQKRVGDKSKVFTITVVATLTIIALLIWIVLSRNTRKTYSPPVFNIENVTPDNIWTLTFVSDEKGVNQTFKLPSDVKVSDLKNVLRENYGIWPMNRSKDFDYDYVLEYLVADNRKVIDEDLTLSESIIDNNDVIKYYLTYTTQQHHKSDSLLSASTKPAKVFPVTIEIKTDNSNNSVKKLEQYLRGRLGEYSNNEIKITGTFTVQESMVVKNSEKLNLMQGSLNLYVILDRLPPKNYQISSAGKTEDELLKDIYVELERVLYKLQE